MSLIAELKRRKVFNVGAAYLVVAWLAVQVVSIAFPAFEAPPWALRVFIVLVMLGFPAALLLAWAFESTPEGLQRDASTIGNKRMFAIGAALGGLALAWYFLAPPAVRDVLQPEAAPAAPTVAPVAASAPRKSIAVLPFVNMSAEKDNEYFSDGMAEEILNALAKVEDLRVAGRTSSFFYKGKDVPLSTIGNTLGVAHVLEGSVRRQGDKVRITAQLIQVKDGFHLWSQTYDGDLADVFELQERIAREITDELKPVLRGDQRERLVPVATLDPVAYSNFLQATDIFNRRERLRFEHAIALLEEAIRLDPAFARAQARLAAIHALAPEYIDADLEQSHAAAERLAHRAIELQPTLAEAYTVIAYVKGAGGDLVGEREWFARALEQEPDDVLTNFWYGIAFVRAGYLDEGARQIDHVLKIDPMLPNGLAWRGWLYEYAGDSANARRVLARALDLGLDNAHLPLALVEHRDGNDAKAIVEMELGLQAFGAGLAPETPEIVAAGAYGDEAARQRAVAHLQSLVARPGMVPGPVPWALIVLGEPALALTVIRDRPTSSQIWENILWHPESRAARRLPEFAVVARKFGYVALWDKAGPPKGCRKSGEDYACD
ncbi:MAG: tetratricopeptide repeat protein [Arenimonas sp.]